MSGKLNLINLALDSSLTACLLGYSPATTIINRVSWANQYFDPNAESDTQANTRWYMPRILPAEPRQLTIGGDNYGYNEHTGIYQVSCYYPKGSDISIARRGADVIASHFKRGGSVSTYGAGAYIITRSGSVIFTQSGDPLAIMENIRVRFLKAWVSGPIEEDRWFHLPVTVRWFADIDNT